MKAMRTIRNLQFVLCGAIGLVIAGIVASALAQSAPQPVLLLQRTNTTQFWLTITNAVASTNYEIYKSPTLDGPWINQDMMVGVVGQSNFLVGMGIETIGFFRAGIGSDWDNDGVPNWGDANPTDPTIGWLSITIDSPTNWASINSPP